MAKGESNAKKAHGEDNTLDIENTVRMHYLRDWAKAEYYVNLHIHQSISLVGKSIIEVSEASPESSLKLAVCMKYLILEIWQSELLNDNGEIVKENLGKYSKLYDIVSQDAEVKKFIEDMRNRFSTHASFTLEKAIVKIEALGFEKIWRCVRELILLKDAVRILHYNYNDEAKMSSMKISPVNPGEINEKEEQNIMLAYDKICQTTKWDEQRTDRKLAHDCTICLQIMRDEFMTARTLHLCYNTEETLKRYQTVIYNSKYMILELDDLIQKWNDLKIPYKPDFLIRQKKYKKIRNQYSAHKDKLLRITNITQVVNDCEVSPYLMQDVEEAIRVARVFFSDIDFKSKIQIKLPERAKIIKIENEIEAMRQKTYEQYANKIIEKKYEEKCEEVRKQVIEAYGLNQ